MLFVHQRLDGSATTAMKGQKEKDVQLKDPYWGMSKEEVEAWKRRSDAGDDPEATARYASCLKEGYGAVPPRKVLRHELVGRIAHWALAHVDDSAWAAYTAGVALYAECGTGITKDLYRSFEAFSKAAAKGHSQAMFCVGLAYQNGEGVAKDIPRAIQLYERSVALGNLGCKAHLGYLWETGVGHSDPQPKKAFLIYQECAAQDYWSHRAMGRCYASGIGVKKNLRKAKKIYKIGYERGCEDCRYELANCYMNGLGTAKDIPQALKLYRGGSAQNHDMSLIQYGAILADGEPNVTPRLRRDMRQAVQLFLRSADLGRNAQAMSFVGECHAEGLGMEEPNFTVAFEYLTRALLQGYIERNTLRHLARFYEQGVDSCGIAINRSCAAALREMAATTVSAQNAFDLAVAIDHPKSTPLETKVALHFYWKASTLGHKEGKSRMASCYERGHGVAPSSRLAKEVYLEAAKDDEDYTAFYWLLKNHVVSQGPFGIHLLRRVVDGNPD